MQYTPSSAKLFQVLHILSIVRHNGGVLSPCQLLELVASQWIPIDVPTWDPCTKVIPSSVIYSARKKTTWRIVLSPTPPPLPLQCRCLWREYKRKSCNSPDCLWWRKKYWDILRITEIAYIQGFQINRKVFPIWTLKKLYHILPLWSIASPDCQTLAKRLLPSYLALQPQPPRPDKSRPIR